MSLLIDTDAFGRESRPENAPPIEFKPVPDLRATGRDASDLFVRVEDTLFERHDVVLYRATVLCDGQDSTEEVVLKVAAEETRTSDLVHEAKVYNALEKLQGKVIPKYYGTFEGPFWGDTVKCLVIGYAGKPVYFQLQDRQHLDFKMKIMHKLIQLHDAGYEHGDLTSTSNVVEYQGEPFLVDLEHAEPHDCPRTMPVDPNSYMPPFEDFKCFEIHNFAEELCVWNLHCVTFYGASIAKKSLLWSTPEEVLDLLYGFDFANNPETKAKLKREAEHLINRYAPKSSERVLPQHEALKGYV